MKSLLLDCGNTRIKWAVFGNGRLSRARAVDWNARTLPRVLRQLVAGAGRIERILCCSVAGTELRRALGSAARHAGLPAPRWVRSQRELAGLRNGYREPWRLGVDRWVAALGAIHLRSHRPLLIVDVGTALTVDLIDAHGLHLGGAIVPGPELMQQALLTHTVGIRRRAQGGGARGKAVSAKGLFAHDTRGGLSAGALYACAALIERAQREAHARVGGRCDLLLAGGAAPRVAKLLRGRVHQEPDLVMMGLAVMAFESLI
ncbi:MAG: type III pantothenate kinase [Steroidobacteraceae bacterium]